MGLSNLCFELIQGRFDFTEYQKGRTNCAKDFEGL